MVNIKQLGTNAILKSSGYIVGITLIVKLFGYIEKIILANYWGISKEVDVYNLIVTITISIFLFFRELIEPGYLTVFIKVKKVSGEKEAWGIFKSMFLIISGLTFILAMLLFIFPTFITNIFAPGFNMENKHMTAQFIQFASLASIFLALSTLTYITLNAYKQFVLAAIGDLSQKIFLLATIVFFYRTIGIMSAIVGLVLGACARLATHFIGLRKYLFFNLKRSYNKAHLKNIWILTWPLLLGVIFSQVSSLIDNVYASYLQEGSISALSYSRKLAELPVVLLPYSFSIVLFPYMSQYVVDKKNDKLQTLLFDSLKWYSIFL